MRILQKHVHKFSKVFSENIGIYKNGKIKLELQPKAKLIKAKPKERKL